MDDPKARRMSDEQKKRYIDMQKRLQYLLTVMPLEIVHKSLPIDIMPESLRNHPRTDMFQDTANSVSKKLRFAQIEDAVRFVGLCEARSYKSCREIKLVTNVESAPCPTGLHAFYYQFMQRHRKDAEFLHCERWTVDRCGKDVQYDVRYFQKQDEFWPVVTPVGWVDFFKLQYAKLRRGWY